MKKATLIMLVSILPFLTSAQKSSMKKGKDTKVEIVEGKYEFMIITGYEIKPSINCLLYTSPSPRDGLLSRMPSSA